MGIGAAARLALSLTGTALVLAACNRGEAPSSRESPAASQPASPSPSPTPDKPAFQEVGDFDSPIHVASPPKDKRLFVVEQAGRVLVVQDGKKLVQPFLDIRSKVLSGGERGLFSIAFDLQYANTRRFYVSYTDTKGDSNVVEYRASADPNRADPASERRIMFQEQPFANHNGGLITFDPKGMLVVGLGDGGSANDPQNRAQNLGTLLGKLLRVDPGEPAGGKPYSIPSDNPFVGRQGALPEIYAYGLRNPWRFWFDPSNSDLYLGDVGQNRSEEIDWVPRDRQPGANFGWRAFEGSERRTSEKIDESRLVMPVHTYPLGSGSCAVVGGVVYRGQVNFLRDFYLFTDNCDGRIKGFKLQNGAAGQVTTFDLEAGAPASFGLDSNNDVYVADLAGKVFKIVKAES